MAKGKQFKMPSPLFNKTFWNHFGSVAVNEYRLYIFD